MKIERNSSIELLRLLCMIAIVIHHFIMFVLSPNNESRILTFFDLILHTSVTIFVLISGFYGIKFKIGKFLNTLFIILFWSISLTLIGNVISTEVTEVQIINSFLPISGKNYWFATTYLELFLVAPFINTLVENIDKRKHQLFICILAFFVIYLGLIRHDPLFDTGKNLANFIFVYSIGRYLRVYDPIQNFHNYIGCGTIIALFAIICVLPDSYGLYVRGVLVAYPYNSPLNVCLSIFIFNIVRSCRFSSIFVNKIALSTFSIYLIHEHPIMREYIYLIPLKEYIVPLGGVGLAIIYSLGLSISCIIIDRPRVYLFSKVSSLFKKK